MKYFYFCLFLIFECISFAPTFAGNPPASPSVVAPVSLPFSQNPISSSNNSQTNARSSAKPSTDEARYRSTMLFATALEMIRDEYVDTSKIDYDKLTYAALRGMLGSLDPHSQFLDPESYSAMKTDTEGRFSGLGLSVGMVDGYLTIHMPIEGGPAQRAGIQPGDRILKINAISTRKLTLLEATKKMRGQPGEPIDLTIYRPATQAFLEIRIYREYVDVPTVKDTQLIDPVAKIAYLRITQFGDHTSQEVDRALQTLEEQGMRALLIDLRDNPGGLLDSAVEVAGKFLPASTPIVSTEGRGGPASRNTYYARTTRRYLNLPVAILINSNSASGAEIVAGALKDTRRALIIGQTTFGKGSVQSVQPLDGLMGRPIGLRLTTAKFYTPNHQPIHQVGVSPHILATLNRSDERDLFLKKSGVYLDPAEKTRVDAVRDLPLQRAVRILQALQIQADQSRMKTAHFETSPAEPIH